MILGAEVGLLIYGIYVLITGKYSLGRKRFVYGTSARILGALCVLPLPLVMIIGFFLGILMGIGVVGDITILVTVLEIVVLIVIVILVSILGKRFYEKQESQE